MVKLERLERRISCHPPDGAEILGSAWGLKHISIQGRKLHTRDIRRYWVFLDSACDVSQLSPN